jgi:hypothetical protein
MLSIRFDDEHEWWATAAVVERLFVSAVAHGQLSPELEEWRHIADANGGFSLADADPADAAALRSGLLAEARAEVERLSGTPVADADVSYRASLEKLVAALSAPEPDRS